MKKFLLSFLPLLCLGLASVHADETVNPKSLLNSCYCWTSASASGNADSISVDLTYTTAWDAMCFTNNWGTWDISSYEKVVVEYSGLTFTGESTDNHLINLIIYDSNYNSASVSSTSDESGTIEFVIAEHPTYTYTDEEKDEETGEVISSQDVTVNIDYSSVSAIAFQNGVECTVTINSIKFVGTATHSKDFLAYLTSGDSGLTTEIWNPSSDEDTVDNHITTNDDGTVALTFAVGGLESSTGEGLGWAYWWTDYGSGMDFSNYDELTIDYTLSDYTDDEPTVELWIKSAKPKDSSDDEDTTAEDYDAYSRMTLSATGADGTITVALSDETLDLAYIQEFVFQVSAPCTLTLNAATLTGEGEGDEEEDDGLTNFTGNSSLTSSDFIITKSEDVDGTTTNTYYVNLAVPTEVWGSTKVVVGEDYTTESTEITAADIVFKESWSGGGWKYEDTTDEDNPAYLDVSNYYQIVVEYSVTVSTDETVQVIMDITDSDGNFIQVSGAAATGTITFGITEDYDVDFTKKIKQIMFQTNVACTLHISSIQLVKQGDGTIIDQHLLFTSFSVWDATPANEYTYIHEDDDETKDIIGGTITFNSSWTGGQWWFDDIDEDSFWGVAIKIKTTSQCKIRLTVVYAATDTTDEYAETYTVIGSGTNEEQYLFLPFNKDYDTDVEAIWIMNCELPEDETSCVITLLDAELIGPDDANSEIRKILTRTEEGYATFFTNVAYQMPETLKGYFVTGVTPHLVSSETIEVEDEDEQGGTHEETVNTYSGYDLVLTLEYDGDAEVRPVVPANTPLLVQGVGDATDTNVVYTAYLDALDDPKTTNDKNYLHGYEASGGGPDNTSTYAVSKEQMEETTNTDNSTTNGSYYYYMLDFGSKTVTTTTNDDGTTSTTTTYNDLGFYWHDSEGGAFNISSSNKAWLAIPLDDITDENGEVKGITGFVIKDGDDIDNDIDEDLTGDGETTGITSVNADVTADGTIYTLQGVRVNGISWPGIYIVNGRKVIKK